MNTVDTLDVITLRNNQTLDSDDLSILHTAYFYFTQSYLISFYCFYYSHTVIATNLLFEIRLFTNIHLLSLLITILIIFLNADE